LQWVYLKALFETTNIIIKKYFKLRPSGNLKETK